MGTNWQLEPAPLIVRQICPQRACSRHPSRHSEGASSREPELSSVAAEPAAESTPCSHAPLVCAGSGSDDCSAGAPQPASCVQVTARHAQSMSETFTQLSVAAHGRGRNRRRPPRPPRRSPCPTTRRPSLSRLLVRVHARAAPAAAAQPKDAKSALSSRPYPAKRLRIAFLPALRRFSC